ncbi:MAG TPA: N-6 DNA methylase [Thermoanaerobaculia bacterium]|nr:N-6 DNA methylase [Thermoanaerobaculia bacterium]
MPRASTQPGLFADQSGPPGGSRLYQAITGALGYAGSPLFCEDDGAAILAPADRHWIRAAREAGARGTYFFRTSPADTSFRPAVHVAEAPTPEDARAIHRRLWNQGINPFLIVVLPAQIRVLAGFAFHPQQPKVGRIDQIRVSRIVETVILQELAAFSADSINRGDVWQCHAKHLGAGRRVDTKLLASLKALGGVLQRDHDVADTASHGLIGKFVYLSYLRARDILSDEWLQEEAGLTPQAVFRGETFSPDLTLQGFRALSRAVEKRFNGHLFPIPWGSPRAPRTEAIRTVARVFAGDDVLSGQIHLPFTAYDFSYIPVELLSAIYEQFLHAEGSDTSPQQRAARPEEQQAEAADPEKQGAHYTPEPLADYLVSEVDSVQPLRRGMKILDPCCGSGIFLVVAFRRLVELESGRLGRPLRAGELKRVLEAGIFGVERNATACQIAGFSLILALLSYVEPPELHRHKSFKFPRLIGNNLFVQDFFNPAGDFWKQTAPSGGFDWIIGNPPWVELKAGDPKDRFVRDWSHEHRKDCGLARDRTGEAFAWRVMECLAEDGAVGLILHAKSLTNDHLARWRQKFFSGVQVHRITNFANLAYVLFASAQQPAATVIYSRRVAEPSSILHVGPFVAHQTSLALRSRQKRAWVISFSEAEVKSIPAAQAAEGRAATWKMALWGTPRDEAAIRRLRRIFSTQLGQLADERGWSVRLGLQLRKDAGRPEDPNEYQKDLEGLKVLDHQALLGSGPTLRISERFLQENQIGCFLRKGRTAGMKIIRGPRLFLWNTFAAYSSAKFIICHDKIGLAGRSSREMKAVAAVWSSSYVSYLLFFVTSAAWGLGYSQIDKGDVDRLPFPELTVEREAGLAAAWDEAAALELGGVPFESVREHLDVRVAALLGIPDHVSLVVRDFFRVRYELNKGKVPPDFLQKPGADEMYAYAARLRGELDAFLGGSGRHRVSVLSSGHGVSVSITLTQPGPEIEPEIRSVAGGESEQLESLLRAAETRFSQWAYVKRNVRIFAGDTIHLIKPPRRLEWTETQALLDAADVIAEVLEAQTSREA